MECCVIGESDERGNGMNPIYEPKGKAREYSPLALNVYNGCDHGCAYCYVPQALRREDANINPRIRPNPIYHLAKQLEKGKIDKQVLLCFATDPYCYRDTQEGTTRHVLMQLAANKVPTAILTKGGMRARRDVDIFKLFEDKIKVGASLTFWNVQKSETLEPGAVRPSSRLAMLERLHQEGIQTWASIEPVIDPEESLEMIERSLPFTDHYMIGKLNHHKDIESKIDWQDYACRAVALLWKAKKQFYLKDDLARYYPCVLPAQYRDMNFLNVA